ncbi:DUF192 domain-containing protein [Candidatus Omnitrophota bacterium]
MKIINSTRDTLLADNVSNARTLLSRIKGLLGRDSLGESEALIIHACNSIHTFFMRFPIDVLFLDKSERIVGLVENSVPFRLSRIYFKATHVVELPAFTISRTNTELGDQIEIIE